MQEDWIQSSKEYGSRGILSTKNNYYLTEEVIWVKGKMDYAPVP